MKGYAEYHVKPEERERLKEWLKRRIDWINSFEQGKETHGWWIFKWEETIYREDEPPSGVWIYNWGGGVGKRAYTGYPYDGLRELYAIIKHNNTVLLDQDFAGLYDRHVRMNEQEI